ncbi:two-component system sensor histidine kinase ChvG [Sphingopyxis panaciterrae]|uniref:sensor histidine kinase n=1 Tax=Sphingopyxis panaciterrae TaxID=363841 RepID=UPI00141F6F29|nr:stimulus-sensing domain-containing protein [Sphingopyxis panaciterrae]NIJ37814.1 two-component system sensor histidine kinase ChvG [Sphingopyxis panaciterrae]
MAKPSAAEQEEAPLVWSARWSLTARILAVNILAVALLAGGFYYLDTYRSRLVDTRIDVMEDKLEMLDAALEAARPDQRERLIGEFTRATESRLRFYAADGRLLSDSFRTAPPTYTLRDPDLQPWKRDAARAMDRGIDWIVGAPSYPEFEEPGVDRASAWPEVVETQHSGLETSRFRYAPERTPLLSSARIVELDTPQTMLMTLNARDITRTVRAERFRIAIVVAVVLLASVLLSLFLARTIVRPLRRLARAAVRVRLGRAREVVVPRLPSRRDEIGTLARALSDMTQALRERIDAGEHFAADVTHELKNPIASVRSAIEGLGRVKTDEQREQLLAIADEDVRRLDRLVNDISEASRVDAQLSRTLFEPVDVGIMIESMLAGRAARQDQNSEKPRIAFARPRKDTAMVMGDGHRLERAIDNVIDNAISFSPPGGLVCIAATRLGDEVHVRVDDDGPGIDPAQREAIFRRFHSERPEAFGRHSGLGLAIARTIIEGHGGTVAARDRDDGQRGASLLITLPAREGNSETG